MFELSNLCCETDDEPERLRQAIEELVARGADIHEADKNGVTPLHHAVRFKNVVAVQTLIDLGADVNRPCKRSGGTPLHRAATGTGAPGTAGKSAETLQIIRMLLTGGAQQSLKNRQGKTAADLARQPEIVNAILGK